MKTKPTTFRGIYTVLFVLINMMVTLTVHAEIMYSNEFWISTNATGIFPYTGTNGTLDRPFDGSSQANFDRCMHDMCWFLPNTVVHILSGTYETRGDAVWGPNSSYLKIVGSGIDQTILKVVGTDGQVHVVGSCCGVFTNIEVSDMTVDGNYTSGSYTRLGVHLNGTQMKIRRVKAINLSEFCSSPGNSEGWGIGIGCTLPSTDGNLIEDCEVSRYQGGIHHSFDAMYFGGNGSATIRNNRIYGEIDDSVVVGVHGSTGGVWSDVLVEGNYFYGLAVGFYSEGSTTNLLFTHNRIVNCQQGVALTIGKRKNLTFAFNDIVLTNGATVAFYLADSGANGYPTYTNVTIFGNTVSYVGTGTPSSGFLGLNKVTGAIIAYNTVDSRLGSTADNCSNLNIDNNFDLVGNYLSGLNVPTLGGVVAGSFGLNWLSSAGQSSALTSLGLPVNPANVVTNNMIQTVTLLSNLTVNGNVRMTNTVSSQLGYNSLNDGLVFYEPFSAGGGANFHDWSMNNFSITPNNPFTGAWISGIRGYGIQLDGSSYLQVSDTNVLSGLSNVTLSCFFYVTNLPVQKMLMSKHNGGTGGEWYLELNGSNTLRFIIINNTSSRVDLSASTASLVNGWHMATATYDAVNMDVYLDGLLVGTASQSGVIKQSTAPFEIGAYTGGEILSGIIDECGVWNRALTGDEVAQLYLSYQGTNALVKVNGAAETTQLPQKFVSGLYPLSGNSIQVLSTNHGLSGIPQIVRFVLVCQTNELGYVVDDEVNVTSFDAAQFPAFSGGANSSSVFLSQNGNGFNVDNKTTGARAGANVLRWKAKVYATYLP